MHFSKTQTLAGRQIPSLDGIRAVSILIVLTSHAFTERIPGGFGVTIFFFLSGFLITTLLRQEMETHASISLRGFYLRRVVRIFPNSYLVLAVASGLAALGLIAVNPVGAAQLSDRALLWQTFYLNNYYDVFFDNFGIAHGLGVYWSLAIEEHFYLLFPAAFLLLHRWLARPQQRVRVMLGVCLAVLIWRCLIAQFQLFGEHSSSYAYHSTDCRLDAILFGCVLALRNNPWLDQGTFDPELWFRIGAPLGAAIILGTLLYRNAFFRDTFRYTLQSVALVPLFIAAISYPAHPVFRWLNHPAAKYVGTLSYSIYLVHLVIIFNLQIWLGSDTAWQRLAAGALGIALSFAVAVAIHRAVELPLQSLRRRLR